jgi:hypothetical protein
MRFPIKVHPLLRLVLLPFGVMRDTAYVDLAGDQLQVRFGWLADYTFPLAQIDSVTDFRWPWWGGFGLRTNLLGAVAVVASPEGVLRITFKERQQARILVNLPCQDFYVSLEDPAGFRTALGEWPPAASA